jgi:D-alanyl-lipoteichoic acid acyltransferase DltB (MBOAT superfamily)
MLFTSTAFLIFLPIVFALYWFVFNKSIKYQNLLLLSTLIDYSFGFWVAGGSGRKRKLFLLLSILNNLLVLCIFKYYNFFIQEADRKSYASAAAGTASQALSV